MFSVLNRVLCPEHCFAGVVKFFDVIFMYVTKLYYESYFALCFIMLLHDGVIAVVQLNLSFEFEALADILKETTIFPDDTEVFEFEMLLRQSAFVLMLVATVPIIESNFLVSQCHVLFFVISIQTRIARLIHKQSLPFLDKYLEKSYGDFALDDVIQDNDVTMMKLVSKRSRRLNYINESLTAYLGMVLTFKIIIFICAMCRDIQQVAIDTYPHMKRILEERKIVKEEKRLEKEQEEEEEAAFNKLQNKK